MRKNILFHRMRSGLALGMTLILAAIWHLTSACKVTHELLPNHLPPVQGADQ